MDRDDDPAPVAATQDRQGRRAGAPSQDQPARPEDQRHDRELDPERLAAANAVAGKVYGPARLEAPPELVESPDAPGGIREEHEVLGRMLPPRHAIL